MTYDPLSVSTGIKVAEAGGKVWDRMTGVAVLQAEVRHLKEVHAHLEALVLKMQEQLNNTIQGLVRCRAELDVYMKLEGDTRKVLAEAALRNAFAEGKQAVTNDTKYGVS